MKSVLDVFWIFFMLSALHRYPAQRGLARRHANAQDRTGGLERDGTPAYSARQS